MANGTSLTEWDCATCGKRCSRKPTKGQRPKYCSAYCRDNRQARDWGYKFSSLCIDCEKAIWQGAVRCSACRDLELTRRRSIPKEPKPLRDLRGPLRRAFEDGDHAAVIDIIKQDCDTSSGCWNWQRRLKDGYAMVSIADRSVAVHRVVLEAKHGAPLGTQHAHHICANTTCVNPDHLQPVTHRENIAEMMARQSYLARIRELEQALADVAPLHAALTVIDVA